MFASVVSFASPGLVAGSEVVLAAGFEETHGVLHTKSFVYRSCACCISL